MEVAALALLSSSHWERGSIPSKVFLLSLFS